VITIPTLSQLYNSVLSDLNTELGITIPVFGKNFNRGLAAVIAGILWLEYKTLGLVQKNIFPDSADEDMLVRWGLIKINRVPFAATSGQYVVTVTGTTGAVIPALTTFKSNDDSTNPDKLFILDTEYTLPGSSGSITIRALESGLDSKLIVSDQLTSTSPIALVNSLVVVSSESVAPVAPETIDDYRRKVLLSFRLEANGGNAASYVIWALAVQGIDRAYPYTKSGASNEINLYLEATIADSTDGKGTPGAGLLSDVEDYIETTVPVKRPLGINQIHYLPITVREIDITITGFTGVTVAQQSLILSALEAAFINIRPFVASIDSVAERNDILNSFIISSIIQSAVPGGIYTGISFDVDSNLETTYQFLDGDIPHLNSVNYV
jgi:uncharacterized phage protein gp47/JayE